MLLLRRLANRNMSVYAQLDALERCGIVPKPGIGLPELLARYSEREYETTPFRRVLEVLGGEADNLAREPLSNTVWHLRVGCISGPGDYVWVAQRMSRMAGQALPIYDVRDEFDWKMGVAWLQFRFLDQQVSWPARIREQWIDATILSRFVALLEAQDTELRFTQLDLGGQDALIGCATPRQLLQLRKVTGLGFEWLG